METARRLKVNDLVIWAKDRLIDDMQEYITDFSANGGGFMDVNDKSECGNYAARPGSHRRAFVQKIMKMAQLLNLREDSYDSLKTLRLAGYWNGDKDTFWENAPEPPTNYKGQ